MYQRPTAPLSSGGVIDDGIKLYRASFPRCWPLSLCMHVLMAVSMLAVTSKYGILNGRSRDPAAMLAAFKSPGLWLGYLVLVVVATVFYSSMIVTIDGVAMQRAPSFGQAVRRGVRLLPRMIGMSLLLILVLAASGVVAGIMVPAAKASGAGTLWGPIAVVVPAVIVAAFLFGRIFLAPYTLAVEDAGALASINLSWSVTRGHWWRASGIYLVAVAILMGIYLVNGGLRLLAVRLAGVGISAVAMEQVVYVVFGTLTASFQIAILMSLYYDLKLRREGADLAARVDALAAR